VGFLDRVIGVVNKVGTPIDSLTDTIGPSRYKRGEELERSGRPVAGRIVGIECKLEGGDDTELFALEFTGPEGPVIAGARIRARGMERLRLGMPVLLRVDDDGRAVLDWQALCARWGIEFAEPAQRPLRSAPGPGVSDTALDMRVQRQLKKWTPTRATIVSFERRTVFGGVTTQNWNVDLQLADGAITRAGGEVVPFYASWLAAPGVDVPVVFDPNDRGKASVDWPAAATEAADRAGALDDAPPAGSIAEAIEHDRSTPPQTVVSTAPSTAADPEVAPIEGVSLETWAAVEVGIGRDRVAPADHDAYAQGYGVPAGRWAAVGAAWQSRMTADWRVGVKIGEALELARKNR
jgi:hypothetical protein